MFETKKGGKIFRRKGNVLVLKWRDKREVLAISTIHSAASDKCTNRMGLEKEKPIAIIDYNKYMSGIDRSDQMLSYYTTPRKTIRWYLKVFFHLVDVCLWNSTYIHNKTRQRKASYLQFREILILEYLETVGPERRQQKPKNHYPKKTEKRRRCRVCSSKKQRSQTFFVCEDCKDKTVR